MSDSNHTDNLMDNNKISERFFVQEGEFVPVDEELLKDQEVVTYGVFGQNPAGAQSDFIKGKKEED